MRVDVRMPLTSAWKASSHSIAFAVEHAIEADAGTHSAAVEDGKWLSKICR